MILLTALTIGLIFAIGTFMLMGKELKSIVMGIFLISHGANLSIIAASGSPIGKIAPVLTNGQMSGAEVDPLPQALILTAIVIGFAVQAFILSMLVLTWRRTGTVDVDELAKPEATPEKQETERVKDPEIRHAQPRDHALPTSTP